MSRIVIKLLFAVALVFAAGFATGSVVARRGAEESRSTYLEDLADRYHLTPAQIESVRKLLIDERAAIDAILARVETEVKDDIVSARKSTEERIRSTLDEVQKAAFDKDRGTRGG